MLVWGTPTPPGGEAASLSWEPSRRIDDPNLQPIADLMRKLLPLRHHVVHALWLENQAGAYLTLLRGKTTKAAPGDPGFDVGTGWSDTSVADLAKGVPGRRNGWSTSPSAMPWVSGDRRRTKCPYADRFPTDTWWQRRSKVQRARDRDFHQSEGGPQNAVGSAATSAACSKVAAIGSRQRRWGRCWPGVQCRPRSSGLVRRRSPRNPMCRIHSCPAADADGGNGRRTR